jgi:hypothetical protein
VENVLISGALAVESLSGQKNIRRLQGCSGRPQPVHPRFVGSFACAGTPGAQEWSPLLTPHNEAPESAVPLPRRDNAAQRFDQTIGGRVYHIEVSAVGRDRWRAQIVRAPGVPTAMMPFYGPTPDAAAGQLGAWLELAHRTARPAGS